MSLFLRDTYTHICMDTHTHIHLQMCNCIYYEDKYEQIYAVCMYKNSK